MSKHDRPSSVPSAAVWSPKDKEWILGDETGTGEVRYWRPDGSLCAVANVVDGVFHGDARRFHENGDISQICNYHDGVFHGLRIWQATTEPTTELMHSAGMDRRISRVEMIYEHGRFTSTRFYIDGLEVLRDGTPRPERRAQIPKGAFFSKEAGCWIVGSFDEHGDKDGLIHTYSQRGHITGSRTWRNNRLHGPTTVFTTSGSVLYRCEYADGQLDGPAAFYRADGSLARRTTFAAGQWAGPLWDISPPDPSGEPPKSQGTTIAPVSPSPATLPPSPAERLALERLGAGPTPTEGPLLAPSPAAAAWLVAIGWGGGDERDLRRARAARTLVKRLATLHTPLSDALRTVGLDRAPYIFTAKRAARSLQHLGAVDTVDTAALAAAFSSQGGPAQAVSLSVPGAPAHDFLRKNARDGRLDLTSMELEQLPRDIQGLPELHTLDVSYNRIASLPDEVCNLPFLGTIRASTNRLVSLPSSLARLTCLHTLHLDSNALPSIPDVLHELTTLTTLNLDSNPITSLPGAFARLKALRTLWLSGTALTTLPDGLADLESLEFLHLGGCLWTEPPECVYSLDSVKSLWLASPHLERISPKVADMVSLETLILWYSNLTELPDAIFEMTHLKELRIRSNPLPEGTLERLQAALPDCTIY